MEYFKNGKLLAAAFTGGLTEGRVGSPSHPGNLKVINNQLIHYETPILERSGEDTFILNETRYSQVTGLIQKWLRTETLADKSYVKVLRVPQGYKGSLSDFI